jgi:hypothetical protein
VPGLCVCSTESLVVGNQRRLVIGRRQVDAGGSGRHEGRGLSSVLHQVMWCVGV